MKYTVFLSRTDNGDTIGEKTFGDYDSAFEYAEIWRSETIAYTIVEHLAR